MCLTRRCVRVRASSFGKDGDGGAVLYLQEIPSYLVVDDCMGFVECSICGLPGESLLKVNPSIELSSKGQLAVAAQHPNSLHWDVSESSARGSGVCCCLTVERCCRSRWRVTSGSPAREASRAPPTAAPATRRFRKSW